MKGYICIPVYLQITKVKGQIEWKRTDRLTDTTDRITFPTHAVRINGKRNYIRVLPANCRAKTGMIGCQMAIRYGTIRDASLTCARKPT